MKRTCVGLLAAILGQVLPVGASAEPAVQTGAGALAVKLGAAKAGAPVTVAATAKTKVKLAGYMRLMICVNGRACGQGAAFWGGGPREIEAKARCAFKIGASAPKVEVRAKSCSARLPDANAALTARAAPGADAKLLEQAFRGNMTCAQVMAAATKFCCDFKTRYKNPSGC